MLDKLEQHVNGDKDAILGRLKDLIAIPSISTDSAYTPDIRQACDFVRDLLLDAGIETQVWETARHPAVFAETGAGDGPVVLVYGHYDVQPPGDLALWHSPPFEPTLRGGALYGRGSSDNKGQFMCHLTALVSYLKVAGKTPVHIKVLIEGEEEIGSPNLEQLLIDHQAQLACDVVMLSDTGKFSATTPAITYGTKGLVYKDVRIFGPKQNLHSGIFGGSVQNPGNALAALIASMRDEHYRVTIDGFYDDVVPISDVERAAIAELPFDEQQYLEHLGSPELDGEPGYSTLERRWARPTLDVNGMYGGYEGEGAMTIIPAMCGAKVSMRLVPDQNPQKISQVFDDHVRAHVSDAVRVEIDTHGVAAPYATPLDLPALVAARRAVEQGFGTAPVMIREGGTIPIMALFKKHLAAESVLIGLADPNCNLHGPNEFFRVDDYFAGIRTSLHFFDELAPL